MKVRIALLAICLMLAAPLLADWCQWEQDDPASQLPFPAGWTYRCYPEYNVTMSTQPDWSLYQSCDLVWIDTEIVNGTLVAVRWYAYTHGDPAGMSPPSCCVSGPYCVVHYSDGSHGLSLVP